MIGPGVTNQEVTELGSLVCCQPSSWLLGTHLGTLTPTYGQGPVTAGQGTLGREAQEPEESSLGGVGDGVKALLLM